MQRPARSVLWHLVALGALVGLVLPGCGASDDAAPPRVLDDVRVVAKPNAAVGTLEAQVVARPAADRARLRAAWSRHPDAASCELHLLLPEGALLVEGVAVAPLDPDAMQGSAEWLVEFPVGRTLDAVVRLCADTAVGSRACEVTVRLVDAP